MMWELPSLIQLAHERKGLRLWGASGKRRALMLSSPQLCQQALELGLARLKGREFGPESFS